MRVTSILIGWKTPWLGKFLSQMGFEYTNFRVYLSLSCSLALLTRFSKCVIQCNPFVSEMKFKEKTFFFFSFKMNSMYVQRALCKCVKMFVYEPWSRRKNRMWRLYALWLLIHSKWIGEFPCKSRCNISTKADNAMRKPKCNGKWACKWIAVLSQFD